MPVSRQPLDDPWRRLFWSLPVGTFIAGMMVMAFLVVLAQAPLTPPPHDAVLMQIIELPPEPALGNTLTHPAQQKTVPKPEPPKPGEPTAVDALPTIETAPPPPLKAMPRPEALPLPPPAKPTPRRSQRTVRRALAQQPRPPSQTATSNASANRTPAAGTALRNPTGGVTMGARALYKPLPDIPEELRHRQLNMVAVASFHVAVDGTASVTLLQATVNPLMNAALMIVLRKWRFFPALENGRPVASIIEIRIPIVVR